MSLILSGSNGVSDVDGTAATPAIRGSDSNTGIFFPAADTIAFAENGVESMRLDSSGNLGLGVTPSAWGSAYKMFQASSQASFGGNSSNITIVGSNYYNDGVSKYIGTGLAALYLQDAGVHKWLTAPSGTAGNAISFTQAMTLDSSGNLLVGKTAVGDTNIGSQIISSGGISTTLSASSNATTTMAIYSTGASAYRFYVGLGGTVYATNTTISSLSDIRYKENIRDLDVGLAEVMALKPRLYDWKEGKGADIKNARGFVAQEFEQVFPDLIDEWKDPAPEGEEPYKSVRQDLIPVLVKALQELNAKVEAQAAEIAALKGQA